MRTVRVIFGRTFGMLFRSATSAFSVAGFLALAGGWFVRALMGGDGGTTPIAAIWAVAAVPFLPVLAALLTMRLVAEDRASGRLDLLLTAPVFERDVVFGRFLAALAVQAVAIGLYLLVPIAVLPSLAGTLRGELSVWSFLPAATALLLQSVLWCAAGLLASACFRHAAAAAFASLLLMLALPHAAFEAAMAWLPVVRARLAAMPFETHIVDFSTGFIRLSTIVFYGVLAVFALFAATKRVARARLCGRAGRGLRWSTRLVSFLAFVFACLVVALAVRLDVTVELPMGSDAAQMSGRTRQILSESHGDVRVTCFLARKAPEFRAVSRLLHGLEGAAEAVAGMRLAVDYVDPRWDFGRAADLVRHGREEGTLVFRRGNREVTLPVRELFTGATNGVAAAGVAGVFAGETACASALQQLAMPFSRETVYWTTGHGETPFDSYDPLYGMSEIAREMRRDGYVLKTLDLAGQVAVPEDCAAIVVAGAREPFSRVETARLGGWMRAGGRLLVLTAAGPNAGVGSYLASAGVKILPHTVVSPRTLSGTDVVARDFAEHVVMRPLRGGTAVFESPVALAQGPQMEEGTVYTELVRTDASAWGESDPQVRPWVHDASTEPGGPFALAVALERGGGLSKEIALRPTRLVVLGDALFVSNGALTRRANANRDVFLNALAWLAGIDAMTPSRAPGSVVSMDVDRGGWTRLGLAAAGAFPLAVFAAWALLFLRRRRSS